MPIMDGYESCRALRKVVRKDVAIIALTGWGQDEVKRRTLAVGFDAHLAKPADPEQLAELINKLRHRPI
jgi:CheY-like chemotaxis protein